MNTHCHPRLEIKIKPQNAGTSFRNDAVVIETVTTPDSLQCGVDVHLETFRRHCFGSLKEARLIPWLPSWPVLVRRGTPPIGVGLTSRGFCTVISGDTDCIPTGGVSFFSICGDEFSTIHGCIIFFFRGTYGLKTSN
ncbi:hypothetical protein Ahy_A07g036891 isoform C [Arachis hypogaea]|uniref:Uncharacterized protein n=1 Tax=Arachis hypogaea TaxID=3818 RepID=A0A445CH77_ARAHY|nr:hypothetical protein Ahy_A07g036891 isoform C [Arachis hypogaea]